MSRCYFPGAFGRADTTATRLKVGKGERKTLLALSFPGFPPEALLEQPDLLRACLDDEEAGSFFFWHERYMKRSL